MAESKIAVIVLGAAGKMGARIVEKVKCAPKCRLAGAFDVKASAGIEGLGGLVTALKAADVIMDFTAPSASAEHSKLCADVRKPLVIGTTGFDPVQLKTISESAKKTAVFLSPNMSPAVNLSIAVSALLASKLPGFDIHISETHHKMKKDAPSGTALKYKAHIEKTGCGPVTVSSVRAGDIIGEHSVLYAGPHERLELTHRAHSRDVFAEGAVSAAIWLCGRAPGLYDYFDLLGLAELSGRS